MMPFTAAVVETGELPICSTGYAGRFFCGGCPGIRTAGENRVADPWLYTAAIGVGRRSFSELPTAGFMLARPLRR